jgi:hypothetical protein
MDARYTIRKTGLDHGVGHPSSLFSRPKTSKSQINMAFKDFGRHPKWPKVADAVIEAGNRPQYT